MTNANDQAQSSSASTKSGGNTESESVDLQQIKADLQKLRDDIGALSSNATNEGKAKIGALAEELMNEGKRIIDDVQERGSDAINSAQKAGEAGYDNFEQQIKNKPFIAILIALGFGLLIGKLLSKD